MSKRHKRQGSDPFGDDYMDDGDEEEDETDEQVMQNEVRCGCMNLYGMPTEHVPVFPKGYGQPRPEIAALL